MRMAAMTSATDNRTTTEKAVKQLKAYGQYIVDNAEAIVSDIDKPTVVTDCGIRIAFTLLEHESIPILEVSHEYIVLDALEG